MTIEYPASGKLPKDFVWGYATAAAQIEGALEAEGRMKSIWDVFAEEQTEKVYDGSNNSKSCESYFRWEEDIALLTQYKAQGYRFSLSWSRIIPLGGRNDPINQAGIDYYNKLINALLAKGIEPWTIHHWDAPQTLQDRYGIWLNREESIADFVHFAQVCFENFGDRVGKWITFNEPWCIAFPGWYSGECAPGRSSKRPYSKAGDSFTEPWIVAHNLTLAHAHAYALYKSKFQHSSPEGKGLIGITLNGDWAEPWEDTPECHQAVEDKMAVAIGLWADPIYLGFQPPQLFKLFPEPGRIPKYTPEELKLIKGSSDFYGCNTYTTNLIKPGGDDDSCGKTILTWIRPDGTDIHTPSECTWMGSVPWGFRKHLNYLYERYKMPIYITETGFSVKGEREMPIEVALKDDLRVKFHQDYLQNMLAAINEDGVDVRSYFAWSLMDNWEWAEGYGPRMGTTYVDYKTGKRYPKNSAAALTKWFDDHQAE